MGGKGVKDGKGLSPERGKADERGDGAGRAAGYALRRYIFELDLLEWS
jgi:hypothetical protein